MATNYNVNPYYDDFDETKQYYRVLFRPGRAVQARELTQIQTNIQRQIERFGRNVFKEGSVVIPGGFVFEPKHPFVKLTDAFGTNVSDRIVSTLLNRVITGANSNVTALVVDTFTSTVDGDPPTLYVKYLSSNTTDTQANTVFEANELITNDVGNVTLQVASSTPTGFGSLFAVGEGAIFTRGVFAYHEAQRYIISKYIDTGNVVLGFQVTESTISSNQDTSLLDPAVGASNYIAPGADRYKIALDASHRDLPFTPDQDPDFVELVRVEDGEIIRENSDPQYNILGDTLARRTFDESGNYTVRPYTIQIKNHLRNANTNFDGYFLPTEGGDDNKFVAIAQPGKAYVKGYEIQGVRSKYVVGNKARSFANVNNAVVATEIGNYIFIRNIYSVPNLSILPTVELYNAFNVTPGTLNGTRVGTAKIRALEYHSGTVGTATAIYKAWLFDVSMISGYVFERDVKQIYVDNTGYNDFTADIVPSFTAITGSVSLTAGQPRIDGTATRFQTDLKNGDYITVNNETFRVGNVNTSIQLTANTNAVASVNGVFAFLNTVSYNDTDKLPHLFEMPNEVIRTVDPTNLETTYSTKRSYSATLSANAVTLTAGTDELFAGISTTNYTIFITSGVHAGNVVSPTGVVTRSGSPTGKNLDIDLTSLGAGYSTVDVRVITTIIKTNSAADKRTKTLVSNATQDYTDANTAQATTISIGKADVINVVSVSMSTAAFGNPYDATGAIDITNRYTFDDGQRLTYYDVGRLTLKPNQPKPTGPIRITFNYFTHGTGDYFSVDSYPIPYDDIPSFNSGDRIYQLRDCIDFRPRINDAGTGFSGTGSSVNDFIDPSATFITDYSYYLPRTDLMILDQEGGLRFVEGISSLTPIQPVAPDDAMVLYILEQKAYVFDVIEDINVTQVDNRRYTMRDIGKIETRVKNLEYYTLLSLLEKSTESLQIQDADGFDKFKNGFIVDNFTGHGIGDVFNRDYGVAVDYDRRELRPISDQVSLGLIEFVENVAVTNAVSQAARTANNYTLSTNGIITLPYTDVQYVRNQRASTTENINPFSVITWAGNITLNPSSDKWFDTQRLPDVFKNEQGNYDQLQKEAQAKGLFNMVWGAWREVSSTQIERTGATFELVESIDKRTEKDVVVNTALAPKMRDVEISFVGQNLKPNTRVFVFFDNINVTGYCTTTAGTDRTQSALFNLANSENSLKFVTDPTGRIEGVFSYKSSVFNLPTGEKSFRITDSNINDSNFQTLAESVFTATGETKFVRDEYTSIRNGTLNLKTILDRDTVPPPPPQPAPPPVTVAPSVPIVPEPVIPPALQTPSTPRREKQPAGPVTPTPPPPQARSTFDFLDLCYQYLLGRTADAGGKQYWFGDLTRYIRGEREPKVPGTFSSILDAVQQSRITSTSAFDLSNGNVNPIIVGNGDPVGANAAAKAVFAMAFFIANGRDPNGGENDYSLYLKYRNFRENLPGPKLASGIGEMLYEITTPTSVLFANLGAGMDGIRGPNAGKIRALANDYAAKQVAYAIAAERSGFANPSWPYYPLAVTVANKVVTAVPNAVITTSSAICTGGAKDPLAQSFFVDRPLYLTKVDLFFSEKDTTIPMRIELRRMVNGLPGPFIIPMSSKVIYPSEITTSTNSSVATTISFEAPIFLDPGEYALVLLAESVKYRVWISQIGQRDLLTNTIISDQPYIGVLFKSQNASTWTPDQYQDLKFTLYRANFDITVTGKVDFIVPSVTYDRTLLINEPLEVYPNSNVGRIYSPLHGQKSGSYISISGVPTDNTFGPDANSTLVGVRTDLLDGVPFEISNPTLNSFTITLPNVVSSNVTTTSRIVPQLTVSRDVFFDTYVPIIPNLVGSGTFLVHKLKTTQASNYTMSTTFRTIRLGENEFEDVQVLPSRENNSQLMSNVTPFIHTVEMTSSDPFLTPVIDTESIGALFIRSVTNNPTYTSENIVIANDIVTIANSANIKITRVEGVNAQGLITFTIPSEITNAAGIIKGTFVNITSNTAFNTGQYRVIDVREGGANIAVSNLSGTNVQTEISGSYTITNGRNFVAEEAAFDGSAYSKYITRQVDFINPNTSFKFFLDVNRPLGSNLKFYYKISEVGDTVDLKNKEYTEITGVTLPTNTDRRFSEIEKLVDNLPQFDAIVFKIVFLSDDSSKVPKCKNFRLVALA